MNRLIRKDGYTTDGYFLIRTDLETYWLQKKASTIDGNPNVQFVVDKAQEAVAELELVQPYACKVNDGIKMLELKGSNEKVYINPEFLKQFRKVKDLQLYYSKIFKYTPVVVKDGEKFAGLIMPIRVD